MKMHGLSVFAEGNPYLSLSVQISLQAELWTVIEWETKAVSGWIAYPASWATAVPESGMTMPFFLFCSSLYISSCIWVFCENSSLGKDDKVRSVGLFEINFRYQMKPDRFAHSDRFSFRLARTLPPKGLTDPILSKVSFQKKKIRSLAGIWHFAFSLFPSQKYLLTSSSTPPFFSCLRNRRYLKIEFCVTSFRFPQPYPDSCSRIVY